MDPNVNKINETAPQEDTPEPVVVPSPVSPNESNNDANESIESTKTIDVEPDDNGIGDADEIPNTANVPPLESESASLSESPMSQLSQDNSEEDVSNQPPVLVPTDNRKSKKEKSKMLTSDEIDIKVANKTRRRIKKLKEKIIGMTEDEKTDLKDRITKDFTNILRISNHKGTFKTHRQQLIRIRHTLNKGLDYIEDPTKRNRTRNKKDTKKDTYAKSKKPEFVKPKKPESAKPKKPESAKPKKQESKKGKK
jgi:hypothetical protein